MDKSVLKDSREIVLDNLELREGSYLKRAACLLFSQRAQRLVSGAWIKIGYFASDDDLRYQDEIRGNLFEQVEKTLDILHTKYLKAYISYQGVQRLETFLFPFAALREALLNAVVHKDYSSGIPIQISVYEHQIVIWNPGQLPQDWTLERLMGKHPSVPFNPLIADAFFRAGYIESWGRGIEKINRECQDHDIEAPVYDYGMSGLMLTFKANPKHLAVALGAEGTGPRVGGRVGDGVGDGVGDNVGRNVGDGIGGRIGDRIGDHFTTTQKRILSLLGRNAHLSARELGLEIGIAQRNVEQNIASLRKAGKLRRVGTTRSGHWKILN